VLSVGIESGYPVEGGRGGPPSTFARDLVARPPDQLPESNQSNVRVTAFFQYL
jgi:hypothetical protein